MPGSLFPAPKQRFYDATGKPLVGGKVTTWAAGTSSKKTTFQDRALTSANTNPIVLDARGEAIMYGVGIYRVRVEAASGALICDRDDVEVYGGVLDAIVVDIADVESARAAAIVEINSDVAAVDARRLQAVNVDIPALMHGLAAFNERGAWATDTAYAIKDIYIASSIAYVVTLAHTSITVAADLADGKVAVHQGATREELAASGGAGLIGWMQSGVGAVFRWIRDKLRESVSVNDFGAVGNDTDETSKLINALAAAAGKELWFEPGKIYRATAALVVPANTTLNLNGSTIKFVTAAGVKNLDLRSGVKVHNGFVITAGTAFAGDGQYHSPIVIGDSASGAGYSNWILKNLSIETARPNGNGICILGNCFNGSIKNIKFPSSATLGRPILLHWAGTETVGPVTTHPHNIDISNITIGVMSRNSPTEIAGVFVSACYNINIFNIRAEDIKFGAIVKVYAGDWGYQYGSATEKALGAASISVKNLYGKALLAAHVYMKNPLGAVLSVWPGSISFDNINCTSSNGSDGESKGVRVEGADGVDIIGSRLFGFYEGLYIGDGTTNLTLEKSRIEGCLHQGVMADLATASRNIRIATNRFNGNNTSSASATADIMANKINGLEIEGNHFDSPLPTWSVRLGGGVDAVSNCKISRNNVAVGNPAGPAFSLGSGSDFGMVTEFEGNVVATPGSNGIKGGQIVVQGVTLAKHASGSNQRIGAVVAAPAGPSQVGDLMLKSDPVLGGEARYICTVAGNPGTYEKEGIVGAVRGAAQADSVATTVAASVADFNALLAKLRAAKLIA